MPGRQKERLIDKTLEGKAVDVDDFQPAAFALPIITDALERYSEQRRKGFGK